jgi:hypothetical protein
MGINGKQKGNAAERAIANEFSERFNDFFQRVPQSGAITGGFNRAKVANLRQDAQEILSGDIIAPAWFPFSIESKCYGEKTGPQMYSILDGNERVLDKWLEQARGDAAFAKKEFLIYFKITRKASYICVDYNKFTDILIKNLAIIGQPLSFIKYKDTIIFDKNDFLDNYIVHYFPDDKRNIKRTIDINNKKEVVSDEQQS